MLREDFGFIVEMAAHTRGPIVFLPAGGGGGEIEEWPLAEESWVPPLKATLLQVNHENLPCHSTSHVDYKLDNIVIYLYLIVDCINGI